MLKNKKMLILTSAVTLLPIFIGLLLWNKLPELITTHWGADGVADGWSSRTVAVFVMPVIMLAAHWLCLWFISLDKKNKGQSDKVFGLIMWIIPLMSLFVCGITFTAALGKPIYNESWSLVVLGLIFVIMGNYLPKCKQNYTVGIKVKWTLASEENWYATHRLAGKLWMVSGLGMMCCIFLPDRFLGWVMPGLFILMAGIPVVYSYFYYRKQAKAGQVPEKAVTALSAMPRKMRAIMLPFMVVILVGVLVVLFTGNIQVDYSEDYFTIRASYWDDAIIRYNAVQSVEYWEEFSPGVRTSGFGSPRLSMGSFRNEELGGYTLYAYTGCDAVVVLQVNDRYLVYGGQTEGETTAFYQHILENCQ